MNCWKPNCTVCKKMGLWEYIFGVSFKQFLEAWEWQNLLVTIFLCGFLFSFMGFWAIIPILIVSRDMEGGFASWIIFERPEETKEIKEIQNKCSAGIENCKICDNEYSHEFNIEYEKYNTWY